TTVGAHNVRPDMRFTHSLAQDLITWSPATNLYVDAEATIPYEIDTYATQVYYKPVSQGSATYIATSFNEAGCSVSDEITINNGATKNWLGVTSTEWNTSSNWCGNTVPTVSSNVVIDVDAPNYPVISSDVEVASITVEDGASITVNGSLTTGDITVESGGNFVVSNGASLIQAADAVNIGNITVHRNSNPMFRLDYTLWSSPVSGQNLQAFSPATLPTRIYKYDAATDSYDNSYPENNFLSGQGYLFRSPNNWIENDGENSAEQYNGVFKGAPHNGDITVNVISNAYNGLGNPYASSIDASILFDENPNIQTIYFWTNYNAPVD